MLCIERFSLWKAVSRHFDVNEYWDDLLAFHLSYLNRVKAENIGFCPWRINKTC